MSERSTLGDEEPLGAISGLWRSEDMELRTMSIERSSLERVVRRFGELGCVQFRDMNVTHEASDDLDKQTNLRCFITQIRTSESIERSLRYFDEQLTLNEIDANEPQLQQLHNNDAPLGVEEFRGTVHTDLPNALETLARKLNTDEASLKDQCEKLEKYRSEYSTATERTFSVKWAEKHCNNQKTLDIAAEELHEEEQSGGGSLGQLIGTIAAEKMDVFNRLIYRVTKGNAVVTYSDIEDDGVAQNKCIFRILYSSFEMQSRILKLTAANGADVYLGRILQSSSGRTDAKAEHIQHLPETEAQFKLIKETLHKETEDRAKMITSTKGMVHDKLKAIARVHTSRRHYVLKEKAMYHVLNMMQVEGQFATAVAWLPVRQIAKIERVLHEHPLCRLYTEDLKNTDKSESPPTYFQTNEFTGTFQGIVDSYGIPRYHEVNPAIFSVVTFPWFFGIMYGDIGHGFIITISAALMIYFQDKMKKMQLNEIVDMVFGARWLLLLMGIFAVYMGFLYNDCFGMMLSYSESKFQFPHDWEYGKDYQNTTCYDGTNLPLVCNSNCSMSDLTWVNVSTSLNGTYTLRCTCPNQVALMESENSCPNFIDYTGDSPNLMQPSNGPTPFGFDAAWHESDNKLTYFNSYKMKNAVICGVLQMTLGLILSLFNHLYFKDHKHIFFGFIPECIFLFCTFGYMCVMLISKWLTPWTNTNLAPNSLETMTKFFLSPGAYSLFDAEKCATNNDCSGYAYLYSGQKEVQVALLIMAVMAIPLMLLPIPIMKGKEKKRLEAIGSPEADLIDMQEVWIKQVIHVIEFVLGCVSNTASYLRLWALSLAHAELSEVFWKFAIMKMLDGSKGFGGGFVMWFGFGAWLSVTFGVLILMEALSAFLHSLRLHWVEFQNKFYVGDGHKFLPLDFNELVEEADKARVG
eukprot:TRINITY_DN420_c1_g1_i1.p1 TRINITY_DN420_c1_g1~~TRINITY_DN420_c1_g1_i1.p1  ORF type:complete len:918 (+),score=287.80 TRINITY_DN420_c1_g1_i1:96-2849(+)